MSFFSPSRFVWVISCCAWARHVSPLPPRELGVRASAVASPLRVRERVACLAAGGLISSSVQLWGEVWWVVRVPPRVVCRGKVCSVRGRRWAESGTLPRFLPLWEERGRSHGIHTPSALLSRPSVGRRGGVRNTVDRAFSVCAWDPWGRRGFPGMVGSELAPHGTRHVIGSPVRAPRERPS